MAATQTIHWSFPIVTPLDGVMGTADLNRFDDSERYIDAGAAETLDASQSGKTVKLDTAAGSVVTLPPATGSGARFNFVVTVAASGGPHVIQVGRAADVMAGVVMMIDTDTTDNCNAFGAAATSNTITMEGDTQGGVSLGEWLTLEDVAKNTWHVTGVLTNTNTSTTPFSAVSMA